MRIALQVSAIALLAALWALLERATPNVLARCITLWAIVGAGWLAVEMLLRFAPASPAARWLGCRVPAQTPRFSASRRVFAAALGAIFLIAFLSWGSQVRGLVGERGLIPVAEQLDAARVAGTPWWQIPSLCWLTGGDTAIIAQCWLGALLSITLAAGVCPGACALLCWALYLSLMSVGEAFGSFQWDALLLESSLLAALWLPWKPRPQWGHETPAQRIGRWLLWWLFFRLMIESGVVKLTWGDSAWLDYSALDYHFESQPLPLWTAWYAHQAPRWLLRAACWTTYFIEIAVPVLLFAPPRWRLLRHSAVFAQMLLQVVIVATGNYTYFNWLTIALCVPFLDDSLPLFRRLGKPAPDAPKSHRWTLAPATALAFASVIHSFGGFTDAFGGVAAQEEQMKRLREEYTRTGHVPKPSWHQPLRSFNGYGLFRTMTRSRPEIVIEGSMDGVIWREYEFPYKAGDLHRRPSLAAPHQPRLDWQMWFAALSPNHYSYLLKRLLRRILEAEPCVLALLEKNPFPDKAPQYVRLRFYNYHFTRFEDRSAAWWKRDPLGETPPFSLDSFRKPPPER
jgi:hypothetical protein